MNKPVTIKDLNHCDQISFTDILSDIYEHSAWIPEKAWHSKPFVSVEDLHQTMLKIVEDATLEEQLALLRAHPQLAGKEAKDGSLTDSSTEEQSSAKLDALSAAEVDEIDSLNQAYLDKHGFPFIIAVKNHTKESIFNEFRKRTKNASEDELLCAIWQVGQIATFRLAALFNVESI